MQNRRLSMRYDIKKTSILFVLGTDRTHGKGEDNRRNLAPSVIIFDEHKDVLRKFPRPTVRRRACRWMYDDLS